MNKLKSSLAAKLIAVTLFVLLLMSLAASVLDIAYIDSINGYNYDYQTLLNQFKYDNSNDLRAVMYALGNGDSPADLNGRNGFYFVIRDGYTNKVVFDGLGKRDYVWATDTTHFDLPAGYDLSAQEEACIDESVKPGEGLLVAGAARIAITDDWPKGLLYDTFNTKPEEIAAIKRAARFELSSKEKAEG